MTTARSNAQGPKTARSIKTIGALLDHRRTRTSSGALLELSALANERQRLQYELERWQRRRAEIKNRLAEITEKEQWLSAIVISATEGPCAGAKPIPLAGELPRVQARELKY
jgi:chromosome segregation ATPase